MRHYFVANELMSLAHHAEHLHNAHVEYYVHISSSKVLLLSQTKIALCVRIESQDRRVCKTCNRAAQGGYADSAL